MSNASFKEQLAAVASQIGKPKEVKVKATTYPQKMNQKNVKPKWLDYVQYGVELLKAYFPQTFKEVNEVQPLKKGIKQDLVKYLSTMNNIVIEDKACMIKSLSYYVNTMNYYKSMTEGKIRIDLSGNPVEPVSCEEAKYSIERFQAKLKMKKST
jgi:sRNA-binding protein